MKRILTIAGSDSGGGAGIQADLKTITVLGGYGLSVITALTAQNTLGVRGVHQTPLDFIRLQMETVMMDIGADAAKTGMLATSEVIEVVARGLQEFKIEKLVVDPVMVAASGDRLQSLEAVETLKDRLLPLALMVTPNLAEAAILCGFPVQSLEEMKAAAEVISRMGPRFVLVKGGHLAERATDVLYDGRTFDMFDGPQILTPNTHGTGCTLSAALATFLAQDLPPVEAVRQAKVFITEAIAGAVPLGSGHGPTNPYAHLAKLKAREGLLLDFKKTLEKILLEPF